MKPPIKNPVSYLRIIFLAFIFLGAFGCVISKPAPDPLIGFHVSNRWDLDFNKAITDDYKDYLKNLPLKQQGPTQIFFYENQAGQHAVWMEIFEGNKNASWQHVLIYDKNNKRIKTVRYGYVKYQS